MTETEARLWLDSMRDCLGASSHIGLEERSMFNDILRFLTEYCCPKMTSDALAANGIWVCPECGARGYQSSHVCGDGS